MDQPIRLTWPGSDKLTVPWPTGPQPAPAWLYTRGSESVRIEVREEGSDLVLLVYGPGRRRRFLHCDDSWALIQSQIAEEAHLLALGYTLERFNADRRREEPLNWGADDEYGKILQRRERTRN